MKKVLITSACCSEYTLHFLSPAMSLLRDPKYVTKWDTDLWRLACLAERESLRNQREAFVVLEHRNEDVHTGFKRVIRDGYPAIRTCGVYEHRDGTANDTYFYDDRHCVRTFARYGRRILSYTRRHFKIDPGVRAIKADHE